MLAKQTAIHNSRHGQRVQHTISSNLVQPHSFRHALRAAPAILTALTQLVAGFQNPLITGLLEPDLAEVLIAWQTSLICNGSEEYYMTGYTSECSIWNQTLQRFETDSL